MFVDADRVVLVTSNIEAERITAEELAGLGSIQVFAKPWFWDDSAHLNRLMPLGRGFKPGQTQGDTTWLMTLVTPRHYPVRSSSRGSSPLSPESSIRPAPLDSPLRYSTPL
ncbi:unnamed protein product [Closterium sp. NIES-64]|nr:unnamed protein product [Closterium sp. NIES-64]